MGLWSPPCTLGWTQTQAPVQYPQITAWKKKITTCFCTRREHCSQSHEYSVHIMLNREKWQVAGTSNSLLFFLLKNVIIKIGNCHHCWTGSLRSYFYFRNLLMFTCFYFSHTVHFCSTSDTFSAFSVSVPVSLRIPSSKTCSWIWLVGDHRPEQALLTAFTRFAPAALRRVAAPQH